MTPVAADVAAAASSSEEPRRQVKGEIGVLHEDETKRGEGLDKITAT